MPNSIWRKRRLKKGLEVSEVANYLDISYDRYMLIDRGIVKMPNKYIEKFNELINKNKGETKVNTLTRQEVVNKWWDEMSVKIGRGEYKLNEKMREFNIDTLRELDLLLGYGSSGMMSNYLTGHSKIRFDNKNRIYSFFENELNIQPPKTKKHYTRPNKVGIKNTEEFSELYNWYKEFDFKKWKDRTSLTNKDIVKKSGLSDGTIHNLMYKPHQTPCIATLRKFKNFIDNYTETTETQPIKQVVTFTSVPVNEVPEEIRRQGEQLVREVNENMRLKETLNSKYREKIDKIEQRIKAYKELIGELEKEKEIYETVLEDLED